METKVKKIKIVEKPKIRRRVKDLSIRFTVFGNPKPKAMARTVKNKHTGKIHSFKPEISAKWETTISGQAFKYKPDKPFECPIALGCIFYMPIPRSFSKVRKELALIHKIVPAKKPDLKNIIANVEDALNEIFWYDDNQVVQWINIDGLPTGKYYSDIPRIEILVVPLHHTRK